MVQILSMLSVLMVLQNNPFDVNNLEEAADKFDFGVNVDDDDMVEGVDTAFGTASASCQPFLASFQATEQSTYHEL